MPRILRQLENWNEPRRLRRPRRREEKTNNNNKKNQSNNQTTDKNLTTQVTNKHIKSEHEWAKRMLKKCKRNVTNSIWLIERN